MNKRLLASAIFAVGAIVGSTSAFAALTYSNSTAGAVQGGSAVAAAGGGAVKANNISITTDGADFAADSTVVVRLPAGINFDEVPGFTVTPATSGAGLTLEDAFGDPTVSSPDVTWEDTNGDGGMDRAVVTVSGASLNGDALGISMNVSVGSSVTAGVKKATVIVNGAVDSSQPIVTVLAALAEPVQETGTAATADQVAEANIDTSGATFILTIPKGTAGSSTITFTPQDGVTWATGTTDISTVVHTPYAYNPLKSANVVSAAGGTATISLTVSGTTTVTLSSDIQVAVTVDQVNSTNSTTTGKRGLDIGGAITGSVDLLNVKANGSTAALTTGQKVSSIVVGSTAPQDLPSFTLTEIFDEDLAVVGGSDTITITPSSGLVFDVSAQSPTLTGMTGTVVATASTMTITITGNTAASSTITISDLQATASSTASGDLSIHVGTPNKNSNTAYVPNTDVVVATAVALGTVDVTGPTTLGKTGTGAAGLTRTATITLEETTYGALTTAAAKSTTTTTSSGGSSTTTTETVKAYIKVAPSSNAVLGSVSIAAAGYADTAPTFEAAACTAETGSTGNYICVITGESNTIVGGGSVTLTVAIAPNSTAAVGDTLDVTLSGNAGVSGTASLASVMVSTTASKGVVPDLEPGSTDAVSLATISISENFDDGITPTGYFRVIAPAGVAFQSGDGSAAGDSLTIVSTFNLNDTMIIMPNTDTISVDMTATIGASASGWLSFDLVDGDLDGDNGAGITAETLMLGYADGTLDALSAGADLSVAVGFSDHNAVSGGLADYTVATSDKTIATAELVGSNVVVTGVAAGAATITVTDHLGNTDSLVATVSAAAAQTEAAKVVGDGESEGASFSSGASSDNGLTFATEFTTSDEVTVVATVNVAEVDQGSAGAVHVAVMSKDADGVTTISYLDEDGLFQAWDLSGLPGAAIEADELEASHSVTVYSGKMSEGTHRIAIAYTTEDGKLVYAPKALILTVTE